MANFTGSADADIYMGGGGEDHAAGNGGNDQIGGSGGNDRLAGNAGADTIEGGTGDDWLFGGDVNTIVSLPFREDESEWVMPVLDRGAAVDILNGGAGDDRIFAGYGDNADGGTRDGYWGDSLYISFLAARTGITADFRLKTQVIGGGTITGFEEIPWIEGSNYDDVIHAGSDNDYVFGMGGNDLLTASYYTDALLGGDGNDFVDGRPSQYLGLIDGGAGNDILHTNSNTFSTAKGGAGNDKIYSHGTTYGGAGRDLIVLQWTYYEGRVFGESGDDNIRAASSGNSISGGTGADILTGNSGSDDLISGEFTNQYGLAIGKDDTAEHDVLSGGGGADTLWIGYGDDADGGAGNDAIGISLTGAATGVTFSTDALDDGGTVTFGGGIIQNIERVSGITASSFADRITVGTHKYALRIDGAGGDDLIVAGGSSVVANGGDGNDRFVNGVAGDTWNGGDGVDTVDYRGSAAGVTVMLGLQGTSTGSGPGGDKLMRIENILGSEFADSILGSNEANELRGLDGDDMLQGRGGEDRLIGGMGNDTYVVEDQGDLIVEGQGAGADTVKSSVSYRLGANVEALILTGSAANGMGNALANTISGNGAANRIDGGLGIDSMTGGAGDDLYIVNHTQDSVVEAASEGTDGVESAATFVLGAHIENLRLTGTAAINGAGNELANRLVGNAAANILSGRVGNDVIDGGAGADRMSGGWGSDTFIVDHAADYVIESAAEAGLDLVKSAVSFVIRGGVEHLELTGEAAVNGTGNALANTITGNSGANRLDGAAGADRMTGGFGNDTYRIDNVGDRCIEGDGGGVDEIQTSLSHTLGAYFENLRLIGAQAIDGTGNVLDNVLVGNAAANRLNGRAGADRMSAGAGDDVYVVDNAGDRVVELVSAGFDSVESSITFGLGRNLENLTLTGERAIGGTGNELGNVITGNAAGNGLNGGAGNDMIEGGAGNDTLIGGADNDVLIGGVGRDLLTGGSGTDSFVFQDGDVGATVASADTIADFGQAASDRIMLDGMDAIAGTADANEAFTFIGEGAFTGQAGQLRFEQLDGRTIVSGDTTGDGVADFYLAVTGAVTLVAADFVL